jgi:hypothetical protein
MLLAYVKKCSSHFDPYFLHLKKAANNNFLWQIYFDRKKPCENKSRQFIQPFPSDNMNILYIYHRGKLCKSSVSHHSFHSITFYFISHGINMSFWYRQPIFNISVDMFMSFSVACLLFFVSFYIFFFSFVLSVVKILCMYTWY